MLNHSAKGYVFRGQGQFHILRQGGVTMLRQEGRSDLQLARGGIEAGLSIGPELAGLELPILLWRWLKGDPVGAGFQGFQQLWLAGEGLR
jgi:hypothetical protein